MTETRRVGEIMEAEIGGLPFLALEVSEVQAAAGNLAETLTDRVPDEFVELLHAVASYEVRL